MQVRFTLDSGIFNSSLVEKTFGAVVTETAHIVRDAAITSIVSGTPGGNIHRRGITRNNLAGVSRNAGARSAGANGGLHRASAPGQPPANETGYLISSIGVRTAGRLSAEVVAAAPYALALEYGTNRIAPRPFLNPAAAATESQFIAKIENAINELIK